MKATRSLKRISMWLGLLLAAAMPWSVQAGPIVEYIHTDHLGNVVAVTDENGNVVETSEYEPYGYVLNRPMGDSPGYTGHVEDAATGLVYMQQRYYDAGIGMFLSVDPVTAYSNPVGQFNRYWYANGNPYLYTDPDGREPGDFAAGFAMGLVFNEQQVEMIAQAEAACKVCGPDLADGMAAGQATGSLLENGVTVEGVVLAVGSLGGKKNRAAGDSGSSGGPRAGKAFTAKGKAEIDAANAERNGGVNVCETCGTQVVPGQRSERGVTPPGNERQRDHKIPKSKGGDGDPSNGQILCRDCNIAKSDN